MAGRTFRSGRVRLAAFDIDETIYSKGRVLPETQAALARLAASGVHTVVSTGRHAINVPERVRALGSIRYAIGSNGATIRDLMSGETLFHARFSDAEARTLLDTLLAITDRVHVDYCDSVRVTRRTFDELIPFYSHDMANPEQLRARYSVFDDPRAILDDGPGDVVKLAIRLETNAERLAVREELSRRFPVEIVLTSPDFLEITPKGVTKGTSLHRLCELLGIDPIDTVAFGDSGNDLPSLSAAGFAVVMGNSTDDIRAIADYITDTVDNNGVGKAIERFFFDGFDENGI